MTANLTFSNEIQTLTPQQTRVVALRVQGKRWSEIADDLGVTPWTIWHWRTTNPEIDRAVMEESMDFLIASKHRMAKLLPLADQAIEDSLALHNEVRDRLSGAKMVRETFSKNGSEAAQAAPIPAGGRLPDDELDRVLSAG